MLSLHTIPRCPSLRKSVNISFPNNGDGATIFMIRRKPLNCLAPLLLLLRLDWNCAIEENFDVGQHWEVFVSERGREAGGAGVRLEEGLAERSTDE